MNTLINLQTGVYTISSNIKINTPLSGFVLTYGLSGHSGNPNWSQPMISFSGASGSLYDSSGRFFGGYQSGREFSLTTHVMNVSGDFYGSGHLAYYFNNSLITNNMFSTGQSGCCIDFIGLAGFIAMGIFLIILTIGFVYEWKKGALEWE